MILSDRIEGTVDKIAENYTELIECIKMGKICEKFNILEPVSSPVLLILGGEPTVHIKGKFSKNVFEKFENKNSRKF